MAMAIFSFRQYTDELCIYPHYFTVVTAIAVVEVVHMTLVFSPLQTGQGLSFVFYLSCAHSLQN